MNEFIIFWATMGWMTLNRYKEISKEFGDLENAWKKISPVFLKKIGENEDRILSFFEKKSKIDLNSEKEKLRLNQTNILFFEENNFPKNLKNIGDPPIFLYIKGKFEEKDNTSLAVVGSRKFTSYGTQICKKIIPELSKNFSIVSGGAKGIDSLAHQIAIENNSRTIGVFGNGLDTIYPSENKALFEKIISEEKGCLISEYTFGVGPEKYNFPRRNRIIAGISLGTIIVEAEEKSGSLITANLALDYSREVFAFPGNIFSSNSTGTNNLIKKGQAKLVGDVSDIFEEFNLEFHTLSEKIYSEFELTDEEKIILEKLDTNGKDIFILEKETGISNNDLSSFLCLLELKGMVLNLGMGNWAKNF